MISGRGKTVRYFQVTDPCLRRLANGWDSTFRKNPDFLVSFPRAAAPESSKLFLVFFATLFSADAHKNLFFVDGEIKSLGLWRRWRTVRKHRRRKWSCKRKIRGFSKSRINQRHIMNRPRMMVIAKMMMIVQMTMTTSTMMMMMMWMMRKMLRRFFDLEELGLRLERMMRMVMMVMMMMMTMMMMRYAPLSDLRFFRDLTHAEGFELFSFWSWDLYILIVISWWVDYCESWSTFIWLF